MANQRAVHVEPRKNGWAVIREGSERAISVHTTQSDAAKVGRDLARREETEFFLHAQEGQVREHRSYGKEAPSPASQNDGSLSQSVEGVGDLAEDLLGTAARVAGASNPYDSTAGNAAAQGAGRSWNLTDTSSDEGTSEEGMNDAKEGRGLLDTREDAGSGTLEERYVGYEVYDRDNQRIGRPDDLFVDENDDPEYVGVLTDASGTRSVLVPAEVLTVDDASRRIVVSRPNNMVVAGPSLAQGEDLTAELEERVRTHYGLSGTSESRGRGPYGAYYRSDAERTEAHDVESGTRDLGAPPTPSGVPDIGGSEQDKEGLTGSGIVEEAEEQLTVRRSEEELSVETREREAGAVRVRKRVRTDREQLVVPKRRVEVTVERVPVEGESAGSEIGEDEIVIPIVEEEVFVEKRPIVKEELRIRKEIIEETEVVEEDVRREEIEVDDDTKRRDT
jgi:uncharacterized protein (TIGR02271 family)